MKLGPADAAGRASMLSKYCDAYSERCWTLQPSTSVPAMWPCGVRYDGPRSMLPSFSSTTWRFELDVNSRRREVANPDSARMVATSGPLKGAERDEEIVG